MALPEYDGEGHKYYYRVVETYIGDINSENDTSKAENQFTYQNKDYPASKVYYVTYDEGTTDKVTEIQNHLIRKTDYQNFIAVKDWNDNDNQYGKRAEIR